MIDLLENYNKILLTTKQMNQESPKEEYIKTIKEYQTYVEETKLQINNIKLEISELIKQDFKSCVRDPSSIKVFTTNDGTGDIIIKGNTITIDQTIYFVKPDFRGIDDELAKQSIFSCR